MFNATDKDREEVLLYNGLYTSSKVLLKNLHRQTITMEEYISESRKMFEIWEKFKDQNNNGYQEGRADAIDEFVKAYEHVISDECAKDCSHAEDDVDCLTCVANKLKEQKWAIQ